MYQIHSLNKISPKGMELFTGEYAQTEDLQNADAVLVRSAAMHEMQFPENLLAVARAGAGVNNIPLDRCAEEGIVVFNTPGANANGVMELALCGMLLGSRDVVGGIAWAQGLKGEGDAVGKLVEKGKSAFTGPEILGKKLGVIGLGAIGIEVANAAKALGMTVYGYDPYLSVDAAWHLSRSIKHSNDLKEIFANCDYISVHVPLTDGTKGMINDQTIATMKDGVRILNFARGALVDTDAMIEALGTGKVAAYVTDFPDDDIIGVDGAICIPHLGASTPESEDNCASMAALLTVFHPAWLVNGFGAVAVIFLSRLLSFVGSLNVRLAVFNLLPVPPLDGSRLLTALLPNSLYYRIMQYEQYIMIGLFLLIFLGVFDAPLDFMLTYAMAGLSFLADLPFFWM